MAVKLLYITNGIDGPGGLERVLSIKASYLAEHKGYEVHIASLFSPPEELFYAFSPHIHLHYLKVSSSKFKYPFSYVSRLRSLVKQILPDVILVCDDGLKGLLAPLFIGKYAPMVYERHVSKKVEIQVDQISSLRRFVTRVKYRLMNYGGSKYDAFVVLTEGNKKEWPLKNLHVIPNPLSFYPDQTELSSLRNHTLIAVGKQSYQKGFDRLLKAMQIVIKKNDSWRLEIYGSKNPELNLEGLASKLGIEKHVAFFDPVKDIGERYKRASICVMSSRYEGFGMVLTEAMSYGLPCVSFDCPYGPSDIIRHGINGKLVRNGDIEGLAQAVIQLIDYDKRSILGKTARADVSAYLPEEICNLWDGLFISLLKS